MRCEFRFRPAARRRGGLENRCRRFRPPWVRIPPPPIPSRRAPSGCVSDRGTDLRRNRLVFVVLRSTQANASLPRPLHDFVPPRSPGNEGPHPSLPMCSGMDRSGPGVVLGFSHVLTRESHGGFLRGCSASAVWQLVRDPAEPNSPDPPAGTFVLTTTYPWSDPATGSARPPPRSSPASRCSTTSVTPGGGSTGARSSVVSPRPGVSLRRRGGRST